MQVIRRFIALLLTVVINSVCFATEKAHSVDEMVLQIQLSPAKCQIDSSYKASKQCSNGYSFTVSTLQPIASKAKEGSLQRNQLVTINSGNIQKINKIGCSRKSPSLTPLQTKVLSKWMPDAFFRNEAWKKHGSCTNLTAKQYFRMVAELAKKLKMPNQITSGNQLIVTKKSIIQNFLKQNSQLNSKSVQLFCSKSNKYNSIILSELQVCYDTQGKYKACSKSNSKSCPEQLLILGLR